MCGRLKAVVPTRISINQVAFLLSNTKIKEGDLIEVIKILNGYENSDYKVFLTHCCTRS